MLEQTENVCVHSFVLTRTMFSSIFLKLWNDIAFCCARAFLKAKGASETSSEKKV